MTIKRRLIRIIMLTTVTAVVVAMALVLASELFLLRQELEREMTSLASVFSDNVSAPLAFDVPEDAEGLLSGLRNHGEIEVAAVYRVTGELFAEYRREHGLTVAAHHPPAEGVQFSSSAVEILRPVELDGDRVGTMYLRSDLSVLSRFLWRIAGISLLGLVAAALAALLLSNRLQRAVSGPILSLATTAHRITEEHDYGIRGVEGGSNEEEIRILYRGFNEMLAQIQGRERERDEAEAEIRRLNRDLERRVRQRTLQLEAANNELARSNSELEQFAYLASHDLQEPLRMVAAYSDLINRRYGDELDGDAGKYFAFLIDGVLRMKQLIDDLLAYSRVGKGELQLQPTSCGEVLEEALSNLASVIAESGAEVTLANLPTVVADGVQLRQVFQNLISNAIKFRGQASPEVHVAAEERDGQWVLSVADNGIGIETEYSHRIFKIFERLHKASEYPGTGIGLALCQRVVEAHGGRIWMESQFGHGSTFYFTLPAEGTGATGQPANPPGPEVGATQHDDLGSEEVGLPRDRRIDDG